MPTYVRRLVTAKTFWRAQARNPSNAEEPRSVQPNTLYCTGNVVKQMRQNPSNVNTKYLIYTARVYGTRPRADIFVHA